MIKLKYIEKVNEILKIKGLITAIDLSIALEINLSTAATILNDLTNEEYLQVTQRLTPKGYTKKIWTKRVKKNNRNI